MLTLITGGARSGKSSHAIKLAVDSHVPGARVFVATAEALDEEMALRIARHRAERPPQFETIEEPRELGKTLDSLRGKAGVVVIDCITLWITNLLSQGLTDRQISAAARELGRIAARAPFDTIIVSGEVGLGIVPENPLARRFRDLMGLANQLLGAEANAILLMVAGYPLRVK